MEVYRFCYLHYHLLLVLSSLFSKLYISLPEFEISNEDSIVLFQGKADHTILVKLVSKPCREVVFAQS